MIPTGIDHLIKKAISELEEEWFEQSDKRFSKLEKEFLGWFVNKIRIRPFISELGEKWFNKILKIKNVLDWDIFHNLKRVSSFLWFDTMLDYCNRPEQCCPITIIEPSILYALTDISFDGYISQKAKELSEEKISANDKDRDSAKKRIETVLNCERKCELSRDLFDIDTREVLELRDNNIITFYGARKRKAYWSFLKKYHSVALQDWEDSCNFIFNIHTTSNKATCTTQEAQEIKMLLENNFHIANPLDLYRLCLVREKVE